MVTTEKASLVVTIEKGNRVYQNKINNKKIAKEENREKNLQDKYKNND